MHYSIPAIDSTGTAVWEEAAHIRSAKLLLSGDEVLVSKLNPRKSRVVLAERFEIPTVSSTELVGLRPRAVDRRFLAYLLQSEIVRQKLDSMVQSVTRSHQRVAPEDLMRIKVLVPPFDEQRQIADFLDTETSRLDRFVVGQKTVATLLAEREQALIDSLVDQLRGESDVVPLRRFIRRIEQGSSPQCDNVEAASGEWGVLKVSAVKSGQFEPRENKRLPDGEAPLKQYEVKDGDLLVTRANTPLLVGATAVAHQPPRRLLLCDKIFRIDLDPTLDKEFVALVAHSTRIRAMCAEASHGASQTMANLKADEIKNWPMPVAPLAAQRDALQRLAAAGDVIARLRRLILSQLRVLAERRQALLTAAVTGQFDVTTSRGADVT
jgi:type I restriction enzyme S subunit